MEIDISSIREEIMLMKKEIDIRIKRLLGLIEFLETCEIKKKNGNSKKHHTHP